jgi:putative tricarboxylic transport membrane protein
VSRVPWLPVVGCILGLGYCAVTTRYRVGSLAAPGPGLFPLLAGLTMTLGAAAAVIAEARAPSLVPLRPGESFRRVPALVTALVAFAILLKPLGFLVASTALAAAVLAICGRRRVWSLVAISVALSAGTYLTFRLLGVPLPAGVFGLG